MIAKIIIQTILKILMHLPGASGFPDSKVHGANMGPIRGRQDPGGPHVGPMNFAIWINMHMKRGWVDQYVEWHFMYSASCLRKAGTKLSDAQSEGRRYPW